MNGLPIEIIVILLGLGLVALAWLLLRFGKAIARAALVLGGLVLAVLLDGSLLTQAAANYQAAKAAADAVSVARASTTGLTIALVLGALIVGALGALTPSALGIARYAVLRWRLAEGDPLGWLPRWRRRPRTFLPPARGGDRGGGIVYLVEDEPAALPADGLDLAEWGW